MAITKLDICDFTDREDVGFRITWPYATSGLISGTTIASAKFSIKHRRSDDDADAIVGVKTITTTDVPGTGQIENDGGADEDMVFRIDLTAAETTPSVAEPGWPFRKKQWDLKVFTASGKAHTAATGEIWAGMGVTKAVA